MSAIEFFSGIGGLHKALQIATSSFKVKAAYDINTIANHVYLEHFGLKPSSKSIAQLKIDFLDSLEADIWLISAPCQPFTVQGLKRDNLDPRSSAILNLINALEVMEHPPEYLLVENVPGFEKSVTRDLLIKALTSREFQIQEFLISPVFWGIPNDRRRYYLTAHRNNSSKKVVGDIITDPAEFLGFAKHALHPLSRYIDPNDNCNSDMLVPESFLTRRIKPEADKEYHFDVLQSTSKMSFTFTKAYGSHHLLGSGPLLQIGGDLYDKDYRVLLNGNLRFFSADEIAMLHGWKVNWPKDITERQRKKLIGNSLNVVVVAGLLKRLLDEGPL